MYQDFRTNLVMYGIAVRIFPDFMFRTSSSTFELIYQFQRIKELILKHLKPLIVIFSNTGAFFDDQSRFEDYGFHHSMKLAGNKTK